MKLVTTFMSAKRHTHAEGFHSGFDQGYTKGFAAGIEAERDRQTRIRRSGW